MKKLLKVSLLLVLIASAGVMISSCGGGGSSTPTHGTLTAGNAAGFNLRVYFDGNAAADLTNGNSASWPANPGMHSLYACQLSNLSNCSGTQSCYVNAGDTCTVTFTTY